jgi:hypothetical protein
MDIGSTPKSTGIPTSVTSEEPLLHKYYSIVAGILIVLQAGSHLIN